MRKLIITCACGQRLQVPYSALGRTGTCTTCGRSIEIQPDNARRETVQAQRESMTLRESRWQRMGSISEDVKQLFGKAVDLFNQQRFAEALAILDSFAARFPGNPDIEQARCHCIEALKRPRLSAPAPSAAGASIDGATLDADTVKKVILEKLLDTTSPAIQLEAAKLAAQLLGMFPDAKREEQDL